MLGRATRKPLLKLLVGVSGMAIALPAGASAAGGGASSPGPPAPLPPPVITGSQLHVVPFPGTPDAPPDSQIIFSSLAPSDLASVNVVGSRSGQHAGHLVTLPDHAGASFVPNRAFSYGERVRVRALLTSAKAGTASGAPGATRLSFSFTVALPPPPLPPPTAHAGRAEAASSAPLTESPRASAAGGGGRTQSFHSQVDFHPPSVSFSSDPDTSSGDILLTPNNTPQPGSMILNSRGQLVYFRRVSNSAVFNLEVQQYQGFPVLTWWHGNVRFGHGINGQDVIMGRSYRVRHIVTAGHGYTADLHEFQIAPDGTALIEAYVPERMNLSQYGGPKNGSVYDCVIQRLDIQTNHVLWEWHSLGHIPLSASYSRPTGSQPWDYLHLNSIQQQPNNNLLISGRNTWGVYLIGEGQGNVIWTLGGKQSSFNKGSGTNFFEWQHDARMIGQTVSVFDDASNGPRQNESQSSAKQILINRSTLTATLQRTFNHSPPLLSGSQGNAETLPNNNLFVGWGSEPDFSEYTASGQQIFNGAFPLGITSYRAYRFPWQGQPATPPSMANSPGRTGDVRVWASWNGATTFGAWRVLGGPTPKSLHVLDANTNAQGFETEVTLHSEPRYFAVQALGEHDKVLGTSTAHLDKRHLAIFGPTAFVHMSNGFAGVPVGCFTGSDCSISLRVRRKGSIVGQSSATHVTGGTGAMLYVRLSSGLRNALRSSSNHRVLLEVTARGHRGVSSTTYLTAIPYSTSGSGPRRHVSQSRYVQVSNTTGFVSSTGAGSIVAACYAATPCEIKATLSAGGTEIATTGAQHLGVSELGEIYFRLNSAGQAMLAKASGNQLATEIKLTGGGSTASGQIALVRYR